MKRSWVHWALVAAIVGAAATTAFGQATLIARYHMDEFNWIGAGSVVDDVGSYDGTPIGSPQPIPAQDDPARSGSPGTCGYGVFSGPFSDGGAVSISGLQVSTGGGAQTSVAFWMYWDGTNNVMPMGWNLCGLSFWQAPTGGQPSFGFTTGAGDVYGISSAGLANGWHHVAAVFTNGAVVANALYIDGVPQAMSQLYGSPDLNQAVVGSAFQVSGWVWDANYRFSGRIDEVNIFTGALTQDQVTALYGETHECAPPSSVPSMSLVGLIGLIGALLAAGVVLMRRRL